MPKQRSIKILIVLLMGILMTILPDSGAAMAYAGYSTSHIPLVSANRVESMGSLIVTFDNLPGCSAPVGSNLDHQFIVKLPADFVIKSVSAQVINPSDASVEAYIVRNDGNQFVVEVFAAELTGEVKLAIDIQTYVPAGANEAINAYILAQPGSVFNDGTVQIARTDFGRVTVQGGDHINVTAAGGTGAVIYFRESQANALREGTGSMTLKLSQGFEWVTPVSGDFQNLTSGKSDSGDFYIEKINSRTLRFDRYGSARTACDWQLTADILLDKSVAAVGSIEVTIDGTSSFTPRTLVIGKYMGQGSEEVVKDPDKPPVPVDAIGGKFKIGTNTYYAGGIAKVMDASPYIKAGRTYVPMRYLGEILGAEAVWDAAARTVTLIKGVTTVVFTVDSTSYTVNGEAKTADVAPEIANDRTMLPARFVAEAFGAVVGWDAASQTVLIQK